MCTFCEEKERQQRIKQVLNSSSERSTRREVVPGYGLLVFQRAAAIFTFDSTERKISETSVLVVGEVLVEEEESSQVEE